MKKTIVSMCAMMMLGAVSLFAAEPEFPGWSADALTDAKYAETMALDSKDAVHGNTYQNWKAIVKVQKAVKANPAILTDYALYKSTVNAAINEFVAEPEKSAVFVAMARNFHKPQFSNDIYTQIYNEYKGQNNPCGKYVDRWYIDRYQRINNVNYQELFDLNFNILSVNPSEKCHNYTKLFNYLKANQFKIKTDVLKEDLSKMNRVVYPNIAKGDDWKQLAVEIQLMQKSLE